MTLTLAERKARARAARQASYERELDDGRVLFVLPMVYNARVCIGDADDETGYDDAWCYPSLLEAVKAALLWNGEGDPPDGWVKHVNSGRSRPDGDPARERKRGELP